MLRAFETSFETHLRDFLQNLWASSREQLHEHMSNLCTRIDFNRYYLSEESRRGRQEEEAESKSQSQRQSQGQRLKKKSAERKG